MTESRRRSDPGLAAIATALEHIAKAIQAIPDTARLKRATAELSAARKRLEAAIPPTPTHKEPSMIPISGGAGEVDAIEVEVRNMSDVVDSAATAFVRLADLIESMKLDPARLQGLANDLRAKADKLGASVAATVPA